MLRRDFIKMLESIHPYEFLNIPYVIESILMQDEYALEACKKEFQARRDKINAYLEPWDAAQSDEEKEKIEMSVRL